MNLRSVRTPEAAVGLLQLIGYGARALPYDGAEVGLEGTALRIRSDSSPARGYGILVAEIPAIPRSLRTFARRLVDQFHDRPLAILGVRNGGAEWEHVIIVRPKLIKGGGGAVSVAKLTIDVDRPSAHDAEVVSGLAWQSSDPTGSQNRIDQALDVERVTRRFFEGLNRHYQRLLDSVRQEGQNSAAVAAGLERAGGAERVALRIVTQVLFCYFLQRKGLLEGERAWLSRRFQANLTHGAFYQRILEPLFYDALAKPREARPTEWQKPDVPFLNGGLFERHYGDVSLPLEDQLFSTDSGLLGFLDGWTFTVSEEAADESEVAVDPEMLGKIFENLVAEDDLRKEGTVYTPRPVVQFMCREALVPYLEREVGLEEGGARELLVDDEWLAHTQDDGGGEAALALARRIDDAVAGIRVLDPAVGSGAFLLGMMSELIRLRRLCHQVLEGAEAGPRELWRWKLDAVERSLFGVDVNATAIELCRLRLWLSLLVEEQTGDVHPLPNLEYRTVSADSLRDFVFGVEVQSTRSGSLTLGFQIEDPSQLVTLRERYFEASTPSVKQELRKQLADAEDDLIDRIFSRALENAREQAVGRSEAVRKQGEAALEQLPFLREQFASRDRVFPAFLPAFHAPEVAREGGWHVVIMNPPYVGRKEVAQRFDRAYVADLERHYDRTYDLMIHFGIRAFELTRTGGVVSMIFNDSIFTSSDATDFRRSLLSDQGSWTTLAVARTRCFQGKAVTGGVVVATKDEMTDRPLRYIENHGRPTTELVGASLPRGEGTESHPVGSSELWVVPRSDFFVLPHRPLYRPSPEAVALVRQYEVSAGWGELSRYDSADGGDWEMLSETKRLDTWRRGQRERGFFETARTENRFILLGLVTEGGQGIATADDRRFLAAVDGTPEAERALVNRARLEELVRANDEARTIYEGARSSGKEVDEALLDVASQVAETKLRWPKSGTIRIAPANAVRGSAPLSEQEITDGIDGTQFFVPFEKGDDSGEDGAARWRRDNPIVIDWSTSSVALLRTRARQKAGHRKPYFRNEHLWGKGGVTWNAIASYLRTRLVPTGSIFGHGAPVMVPVIDWLSAESLLALTNATVTDFALRTFLASRMNTHVGDIRRLLIPMLTDAQASRLHGFGVAALEAKRKLDGGGAADGLDEIESELNKYARELYGIKNSATLWVVR